MVDVDSAVSQYHVLWCPCKIQFEKKKWTKKRTRKPNWTEEQCLLLAQLVKENKVDLKGKFGPGVTSQWKTNQRLVPSPFTHQWGWESGTYCNPKWEWRSQNSEDVKAPVMVWVTTLLTEGWDKPKSSLLYCCIFPVARYCNLHLRHYCVTMHCSIYNHIFFIFFLIRAIYNKVATTMIQSIVDGNTSVTSSPQHQGTKKNTEMHTSASRMTWETGYVTCFYTE